MSTSDDLKPKKCKIQPKLPKFFTQSPVVTKLSHSPESLTSDNEHEATSDNESEELLIKHNYPSCWNIDKYEYFTTTYPWLICASGYLGCKACKSIALLGCSPSKRKRMDRNEGQCSE